MNYKVLIEMGLRGVTRHFLRLSPEGISINNNNNNNNKNNNNNNNNESTVIKIMMKIFNLLMESGILPTDLKGLVSNHYSRSNL